MNKCETVKKFTLKKTRWKFKNKIQNFQKYKGFGKKDFIRKVIENTTKQASDFGNRYVYRFLETHWKIKTTERMSKIRVSMYI